MHQPGQNHQAAGDDPSGCQLLDAAVLEQGHQARNGQDHNTQWQSQRQPLKRVQAQPPGNQIAKQIAGCNQQGEKDQPARGLRRQDTRHAGQHEQPHSNQPCTDGDRRPVTGNEKR